MKIFHPKKCDAVHVQMYNMIGLSFHTTILCFFHYARNDFDEECLKFGGQTDTSKAGRKKGNRGFELEEKGHKCYILEMRGSNKRK